jgi:hypothetical protein
VIDIFYNQNGGLAALDGKKGGLQAGAHNLARTFPDRRQKGYAFQDRRKICGHRGSVVLWFAPRNADKNASCSGKQLAGENTTPQKGVRRRSALQD